MKRSRDYRRHQEEKKKSKVLKSHDTWWWPEEPPSKRMIGKKAHTPAMCSCHMCGNPRKYWKEKTLQEKISEIKQKET
jgi:hypothetical protein|tara:strand:+ start:247 stop:480 length:234 start_codon:yes stop_codon:yes gene_type:complete